MKTPAAATSESIYQRRLADWRNGAIVYQVFVDRFAPSANLDAKRDLYPAPKTLHPWSETPKAGKPDPTTGNWSHELSFWGGDLASVESKLDYVKNLGADVLYLTPIFAANTNHKYDTQDYLKISPEFGTKKDFKSLIKATHGAKMKLMLDGVFNHMGRTSPMFQSALHNPKDPYRDWFFIDPTYKNGYRGWAGVAGLPGLNLENKAVRDYLWNKPDSVVRSYLKEGIDGWRLDVAFELGPDYLRELTEAAHKQKPGSPVVGEISGYPADWFPSVDGVFNFFAPNVVISALQGRTTGGQAGRILADSIHDAGIENTLKSWLHLDNHDTPRLPTLVPNHLDRHLALAALFTLPGCPVVYYGTELGMAGNGDPANRAPMRWDLVTDDNEVLTWTKKLIKVRKSTPALRVGDFKALATNQLLAFSRTTDKIRETAIVVFNPTNETVTETFSTRVGRLMSWGELKDTLSSQTVRSITGLLTLTVKPKSVMILVPVDNKVDGGSPYNRIP